MYRSTPKHMESSGTKVEQESIVDDCIRKHHGLLIAVLQEIQRYYNYLPKETLSLISQKLDMPLRDIYGTASFYKAFSFQPKGKHIITTCLGTACHVRGGQKIADVINKELNIRTGETTADRMFTHESAACLGCCAIGPIVMIDGDYHSEITTDSALKLVRDIRSGANHMSVEQDKKIFPIKVSCPRCNHSLMKPEHPIDNHPCIHITISFKRQHGWIRLSSLYGSHNFESEFEIPLNLEANFYCPHCHADLVGTSECPECGAKMILMIVEGGGTVQVCSKCGCKGHLLDI